MISPYILSEVDPATKLEIALTTSYVVCAYFRDLPSLILGHEGLRDADIALVVHDKSRDDGVYGIRRYRLT